MSYLPRLLPASADFWEKPKAAFSPRCLLLGAGVPGDP